MSSLWILCVHAPDSVGVQSCVVYCSSKNQQFLFVDVDMVSRLKEFSLLERKRFDVR